MNSIYQGCTAGVLLALSACGPGGCDENKVPLRPALPVVTLQQPVSSDKAYSSLQECMEDTAGDDVGGRDDACQKAFTQASQIHVTTAPKFEKRETCEDRYGVAQCVPRQTEGGHDVFVPMMTGFMLGHMLGGSQQQQPYTSQPAYGGFGGRPYVTGSGAPVRAWSYSGSPVRSYAPTPTVAPPPVLSRGGFGSAASSAPAAVAPTPAATSSSGVARGGFGGSAAAAASSGGG